LSRLRACPHPATSRGHWQHLENYTRNCYIWSIALYGAETLTLRKVDQKYLESFEMWCWRRMKIIWTDRVRNEVLGLRRVKEEGNWKWATSSSGCQSKASNRRRQTSILTFVVDRLALIQVLLRRLRLSPVSTLRQSLHVSTSCTRRTNGQSLGYRAALNRKLLPRPE
jgi:hypothetical protein